MSKTSQEQAMSEKARLFESRVESAVDQKPTTTHPYSDGVHLEGRSAIALSDPTEELMAGDHATGIINTSVQRLNGFMHNDWIINGDVESVSLGGHSKLLVKPQGQVDAVEVEASSTLFVEGYIQTLHAGADTTVYVDESGSVGTLDAGRGVDVIGTDMDEA